MGLKIKAKPRFFNENQALWLYLPVTLFFAVNPFKSFQNSPTYALVYPA
jgi:hypothetical protein